MSYNFVPLPVMQDTIGSVRQGLEKVQQNGGRPCCVRISPTINKALCNDINVMGGQYFTELTDLLGMKVTIDMKIPEHEVWFHDHRRQILGKLAIKPEIVAASWVLSETEH